MRTQRDKVVSLLRHNASLYNDCFLPVIDNAPDWHVMSRQRMNICPKMKTALRKPPNKIMWYSGFYNDRIYIRLPSGRHTIPANYAWGEFWN